MDYSEVMAMIKIKFHLFALLIFLYFTVTGCSDRREPSNEQQLSVISEMIPENITQIEVSDFYNGEKLEPWELDEEEIKELAAWISELSLMHKTYGEGEALYAITFLRCQ